MKTEKRPAITEVFARSQFIGAVLLIGIIAANFLFLYRKERSVTVAQRNSRVQIACSEANSRIRSMESTVNEILSSIRNQYEGLRSGNAQQKTMDKLKLNRTITDKRLAQPELEYVFVIRPGDFTIFHGAEDIFPRLNIKDYLEEYCRELPTTSRQWRILNLGEKTYFIRCTYYRDADIYVGAASQPSSLLSELLSISDEDDMTLLLEDSQGNTYRFGDPEKTDIPGSYSGTEKLEGSLQMEYAFVLDFLQLMQRDLVIVLLLIIAVCAVVYGYTHRQLRTKIIRPVQDISQAVQDLGDLTILHQIPEQAPVKEIHHLEVTVNTLLQNAVYSHMQLYTTELQKKGQELRLLRSQLRPHFFLNAITTVSTMTYRNQGEEIRDYLVKLSAFLRYILTSEDAMATLDEELSCLENYLQLQETRYPGRLFWFREEAEELKDCRIPRFLLLTVGENAMKYGMRSEDILQVFISCTVEGDCALIAVEDNGPGFTPEQLAYYNQPELPETSEDHLGLSNIKRSLALQYGRQDLMRVSAAVPEGARVEIRIPLEKE